MLCGYRLKETVFSTPNTCCNFNIHPQQSKREDMRIILAVFHFDNHKGNGISGRDNYVLCSSVMLGTACTD